MQIKENSSYMIVFALLYVIRLNVLRHNIGQILYALGGRLGEISGSQEIPHSGLTEAEEGCGSRAGRERMCV